VRPKAEAQLRAELTACARSLAERNFCPATSGNLSARLDTWRILVTPTGVPKADTKDSDLVVVSPDGAKRFGRRNPTSELDMHLQIYRLRPEVGAIVHAHPPIATAFACAGIALDQPIASEFSMAVGKVPLAPYGTPGTPELADAMGKLITGHTAILMGNHGVVAYGKDVADACGKMHLIEHFAEIVLATLKIGQQVELSAAELQRLNAAAKRYATGAGPLALHGAGK
jgi:L-fuculose-phosphate aldolase